MHLEVHEENFELWVVDEDALDECQALYKGFLLNRSDAKYRVKQPRPEEISVSHEPFKPSEIKQDMPPVATRPYFNAMTKVFVALCIFVYLIGLFEGFNAKGPGKKMATLVLTRSETFLLFDYPLTLQLINQFATTYGDQEKPSVEAQEFLRKIEGEPYFQGFYKALVNYKEFAVYWTGPKFGSILKGQIWRLITPTFLHASLLHILFNMLWLLLLGKLVETNLGAWGYLALTIFLGVSTNICQYLMTGPLFMGYSGVIAGLAGYIWARQKKAPYEFYPIERRVLRLLGIFIFGLLALQVIAFILQVLHLLEFNMRIANTAHVSGIILGYIIGRMQPGAGKKRQ